MKTITHNITADMRAIIAGGALLCSLLFGTPSFAAESPCHAKNPCQKVAAIQPKTEAPKPKKVNYYEVVTLGKAKTLELDGQIADLVVADPSVIEVGTLKNNKLYIVGSSLGDTNILAFNNEGETVARITVHVKIDEYTLNKTLKQLFPKDKVSAKTVGDDIILTGKVENAAAAASIHNVATRFAGENNEIVNMMTVSGEQQVMIKVKVVEIRRSILNELGVDTDIGIGDGGDFDGRLLTNNEFGFNPLRQAFGLTTQEPFGLGQLIFDPDEFNPISFMINALEQDALVNTLAEPNLTAKSGENARFLAGGEIPVVADRNDERVTFDYRPYGVVLSFRPLVMDEGRISLQISTEVSEISPDTSTVIAGVPFPSFDVRRADTTVEMASGGSIMIAGMARSQTINNLTGVPGAKSAPVIGELMSSDSFQREESELLVMISAYLIKPNAAQDFAQKRKKKDQDHNRHDHPILRHVVSNNLEKQFRSDLPSWTGHEKNYGYMLD